MKAWSARAVNEIKHAWGVIKHNPVEALKIVGHDFLMFLALYLISNLFSAIIKIDAQSLYSIASVKPLLYVTFIFLLLFVMLSVLIFSYFQLNIQKTISKLYYKKISISLGNFFLANLAITVKAIITLLLIGTILLNVRQEFLLFTTALLIFIYALFFYSLFSVMHAITRGQGAVSLIVQAWKNFLKFKYLKIIGFSLLTLVVYAFIMYLFGLLLGNTVVNETNFAVVEFVFKSLTFNLLYIIIYMLAVFNRFWFFYVMK